MMNFENMCCGAHGLSIFIVKPFFLSLFEGNGKRETATDDTEDHHYWR